MWWLSKVAPIYFDIKYRTGKSNQVANALSHHPKTSNDNFSNSDSDEYETISYPVVCDGLCKVI